MTRGWISRENVGVWPKRRAVSSFGWMPPASWIALRSASHNAISPTLRGA
jgi:hypothetical protein